MALKYWEQLIDRAHIKAQGRRDLYNQTYVHEFQLDPKWTYKAIEAFVKEEMPEVHLEGGKITEFVDYFHTTIGKSSEEKPCR